MNSKRRAELQRKLSMGPVARPPADLLDRIKADIPNHLKPEAQRRAFVPSLPFSMRIAASLILLVLTGVVTFKLVQPSSKAQLDSVTSVAKMEWLRRPWRSPIASKAGSPTAGPASVATCACTVKASAASAPRLACRSARAGRIGWNGVPSWPTTGEGQE